MDGEYMKCNNCGFEFDEGIFCPECGTKYDEEEAKRIEAEKAEIEKKRIEELKVQEELQKKQEAEQREKDLAEAKEIERTKQEELSRTFNGVLYASVDEMNAAKEAYESELKVKEQLTKSANTKALISMIIGLIALLFVSGYVGMITAVISLVLGILALKANTTKRGFAITGIVTSILCIGIAVMDVVFTILGKLLG